MSSALLFVLLALLFVTESKWVKKQDPSDDDDDDDYDIDDFDIEDLEELREIVINTILNEKKGLTHDHPMVHPLDLVVPGDLPLLANIVRLIFHDCAGFDPSSSTDDVPYCNGCISLSDPENAGLEQGSVLPLQEICDDFYSNTGLSTADCWALSATFALELSAKIAINALAPSQYNDNEIPRGDIPYYIGRKDCSTTPDGPTRNLFDFPDPDLGWDHIESFFKLRYPTFTNEDIVALVGGGHSLGRGHILISGYSSEWDASPTGIDNHYFQTLTNVNDQFTNDNPFGIVNNWFQGNMNDRISTKKQFMLQVPEWDSADFIQKNNFLMLNADISLAWNLSYYIDNGLQLDIDCTTLAYQTCYGNQTLLFPGDLSISKQDIHCQSIQCPVQCPGDVQYLLAIENSDDGVRRLNPDAKCTAAFSREFARDNKYFMKIFKSAFIRMFTSGYRNEKTGKVDLEEIEYTNTNANANADVVSGLIDINQNNDHDGWFGFSYEMGSMLLVITIICLNVAWIGYRLYNRYMTTTKKLNLSDK